MISVIPPGEITGHARGHSLNKAPLYPAIHANGQAYARLNAETPAQHSGQLRNLASDGWTQVLPQLLASRSLSIPIISIEPTASNSWIIANIASFIVYLVIPQIPIPKHLLCVLSLADSGDILTKSKILFSEKLQLSV